MNKNIMKVFGAILFVTMIVAPASYQILKISLLGVVFFGLLSSVIFKGRAFLSRKILGMFLFYISLGLFFGFYGVLRGNEGVTPITKEIVLYVFIYMFLTTIIDSLETVKGVHRVLLFSNFLIGIYLINQLLYFYGYIPDSFHVDLFSNTTATQSVNIKMMSVRGSFGLDMSMLPSFMFIQPYLISYVIVRDKNSIGFEEFLIFLNSFFMIFAGKRILLLIALSSPILVPLTISLIKQKIVFFRARMVACIASFIIVSTLTSIFVGYDFSLIYNYFTGGFSLIRSGVDGPRTLQFYALLNGWSKNPFFGYGSGAVCTELIRSVNEPWLYELSFLKYLYDFGIVGFLLYALGFIYLWVLAIRIFLSKDSLGPYAISAFFGCLFFLSANFTNPYLLKFDYLFTVFYLVAIVNLYSLKNDRMDHNIIQSVG